MHPLILDQTTLVVREPGTSVNFAKRAIPVNMDDKNKTFPTEIWRDFIAKF